MDIFGRTRFIVQRQLTDFKDTLGIMDADMKLLCYVKHQHSWKMPRVWKGMPIASRVRTTDVRLEGIDGALLGEIHEIPTGTMRMIIRWEVYDEKGGFKGAVKEKPKFIGSDWVLENAEGNVVATIKGDRKKHDYEILTADRYEQAIARCFIISENSYGIDILLSNLDPFLVLSYIVVLDLAKMAIVIS
jgi:uncharacterized protein YxjI